MALLNHLPLNDEVPGDAIAMGVVRRPSHVLQAQPDLLSWCAVQDLQSDAEQLWLMQQHPQLLVQLELKNPLMQWMVAARKDHVDSEVLDRMPKTAALQQTLQLAKKRPARAGGR